MTELPTWFKRDLSERLEIKEEEIAAWCKQHSAGEIFEEWCSWHGFLGWSGKIMSAAGLAKAAAKGLK